MKEKIVKAIHRVKRILKWKKRGVYCTVGERNRISDGIYLHEMAKIGNSNFIGVGTKMMNAIVGNYCSIADNVKIGLMEHDLNCISTSWRIFEPSQGISSFSGWMEPAVIENDVWLASNVVVKQGVIIHTGAVVGAGAVVVKDVPPFAIVGGGAS
jgi:acetyltransferase-like isoleucine patch superfamily enzyme